MELETLDVVAQNLEQRGYAVIEGFLGIGECQALQSEMDALHANGAFHAAGVGRGQRHRVLSEVRSDDILWLSEAELSQAQALPWQRLETLRIAINRRLMLGLRWFEGHLAIYPPGGRYVKHLDRFDDATARTLSFVLYLNPSWQEVDGGKLRIFARDLHDRIELEVAPRTGTLVCFLSNEIPHEVLPPTRTRYSLTGWYRTDLPG